jgi:excisionase family DNA binding protein
MKTKQTELTAIEAARKLGVGLDYLYGLVWTGKVLGRKEGKRWRISHASVEARLNELRGQRG